MLIPAVVHHKQRKYNSHGFSILTTLLIGMSVLGVLLSVFAVTSIGAGSNSLTAYHGKKLEVFAKGCFEESLLRLRKSGQANNFTVTGEGSTCSITISGSTQPNQWNIQITAMMETGAATYQRIMQSEVRRMPNSVRVLSLQEQ